MAEDLKYTASAVGFDKVEAGLKGVNKELVNSSVAAQKVDSSLGNTGLAFTKLASSGQKSIFILKESLRELQAAAFTEKDLGKLSNYNKQISVTQGEIKKLETAGKSSFGALGAGAGQAYSSIKQIANILPGLGISTIFLLGYEAVIKLISGLDLFSSSLTKTKEAQNILNEAMTGSKSAYVDAVKNVQELTINIDLAKKGFLSKESVLKQYNGTIGKTTGQVTSLDEAEQQLVKNGPAYIQMILYKAAAQIALEKAAKKVVDAQIEYDKQQKISTDLTRKGEAERDRASGASGLSEFLSKGIKNESDAAKVAADKASKQLQDIALQFQTDAANIAKSFNGDFFGDFSGTSAKAIKDIRTVQDVLNDLAAQIKFVSDKNIVLGTVDARQNISALTTALDELLKKFKLGTSNKIILDLAFQITSQNIRADIEDFKLREYEKIKKGFEGERQTGKGIKPKIVVRPKLELGKIDKELEEFSAKVSSAITNILGDAVTNAFDAVAQIASGNSEAVPNLFGKLISNVGGQIQELGKFLITSGVKIKLAKDAFQKLLANPIASIAVGIGLVALGALLKAQASKKFQGFATGVRNFSGGTALVGERGPELVNLPRGSSVIPNNETTAYGGGQQVFIPALRVSGQDLVIVFNRANATNRRNN